MAGGARVRGEVPMPVAPTDPSLLASRGVLSAGLGNWGRDMLGVGVWEGVMVGVGVGEGVLGRSKSEDFSLAASM